MTRNCWYRTWMVPGGKKIINFHRQINRKRHCYNIRQNTWPTFFISFTSVFFLSLYNKNKQIAYTVCVHRWRSRQIFRGPKGFFPVFPQTSPKRFCVLFVHTYSPTKYLKTYFWCDLQKKVLIVFFCKRWAPFLPVFSRILARCPEDLPKFSTNQNFGGTLAPSPPPPSTTRCVWRHEDVKHNEKTTCHSLTMALTNSHKRAKHVK